MRNLLTATLTLTDAALTGVSTLSVGTTHLATRTDTTVSPAESGFLDGPGVDNSWIQDYYPLAVILHEDMPRDRRVRELVISTIEQLRPLQ